MANINGSAENNTVTRTVRTERNAVFLDASNDEYLFYKVTAQGGTPLFTLVDSQTNNLIMSSKDAPTPPRSGTFQREWPKPADPVATASSHTLGMHFLAAIKYTFLAEHRVRTDKGSNLIETLVDIDYESQTATDVEFQRLGVTTV